MRHFKLTTAKLTTALLGIVLLGSTAFAEDPANPAGPSSANPGTVNYVEGAANLEGRQLNNQSVGQAVLEPGQVLATGQGKAEILLTPGIYLRLDSQSAVKMISPDLAQTQVELVGGRASVEVDQISPQNDVQIIDAGVTTQVVKPGYYEFDAAQPAAMVFKGQAEVELGANKWEEIKGGHELALTGVTNGAREKTVGFNANGAGDELYAWSSLRSQYLAEGNNQIAREYMGSGFYPGWYWNPYGYYTYIGVDPFLSPFGWGFYPWGGWGGWGYWGGFGPGFYRGGFYGGRAVYGGGGFHGGGGFGGRR